MSVSINQIVYQYLQFASEQQRGLVNIARDISQINSRVTDIINLYANGNRLSQFDRRLREVRENVSVSPTEEVEENIRNLVPTSDNNDSVNPEIIEDNNDNPAEPVSDPISDPISSEPISEPNTMEEGRERTTSFHERDFPSTTRDVVTRVRHRRSSMVILGPRASSPPPPPTTAPSIRSYLTRPSIPPPPPPPPLEIPPVREMARDSRQSPRRDNWTVNLTGLRNNTARIPVRTRHRVFRFSGNTTGQTNFTNPIIDNLSPVRIRPSVSQVRRGTELLTWTDISDNYQQSCPIDLVPFSENDSILRIRHCKHIFREMNLRRHFRNSPNCPICRYDIRDYIAENNAPPIIPEDIEDVISDNIVNLVEEAVSNISRNRSNRRNHSSISLT